LTSRFSLGSLIQLELSENQMNYIASVLDDTSIDYKSKYLQIITYLNASNERNN